MIYLARNEKGVLERIQVARARRWDQPASWGAYNIDGTKIIVPFDESHTNYESILNILLKKYKDVRLSRRSVDYGCLHIICINEQYGIYDDDGYPLYQLDEKGCYFSDKGIPESKTPHARFPDYYYDVEVIHKDKLWVAKDIDTGKWVCLKADGSEVATHDVKEACTQSALRRLS